MPKHMFKKKISREVSSSSSSAIHWVQFSEQQLRFAKSAQLLWQGTEQETIAFDVSVIDGQWQAWLESQGLSDTLLEHADEWQDWAQRTVCCVIPNRLTVTEVLKLPQGSRAECEQMIREELSENPRLRNDNITFTFQLLDQYADSADEQTVQVTAVADRIIEMLVTQFAQRGIYCRRVINLSQFLAEMTGRTNSVMTGILDWGLHSLHYVLAEQNRSFYEREIRSNSLAAFVRQLATGWNLSQASALAIIRQIERKPVASGSQCWVSARTLQHLKSNYETACELQAAGLAVELKKTVEFSRQKHYQPKWNGVVVGGAVHAFPTLLNCLQKHVGFPVIGWDEYAPADRFGSALPTRGQV